MMYLVVFFVENPGMVSGGARKTTRSVSGWLTASSSVECLTRPRHKSDGEESQIDTYQYFLHLSLADQAVLYTTNTIPDHEEDTVSRLVLTSRLAQQLHVLLN
jgi:hypothetical protein